MLLGDTQLAERRRMAVGALAPLADSLARDLEPLVQSEEIYIPSEKARLTRAGGRCPRCGAMLDFDPWSPHRHRCPAGHGEFVGAEHDGMWITWYQLWLAERAVHAAALYVTRGNPLHKALAQRILAQYSQHYLGYPNRDNVLGPTRPFFSTYLESIWVLQLACALDILESGESIGALGSIVRNALLEPSAALIAQYDEGLSNRQVWNNAALVACGTLLGDAAMAERATVGPSGLLAHLERGLLPDGTWYEGENYHLFAHRGLWYGVTLTTAAGVELPNELRERYLRAFETPFLTALPDFTFPARRDSQYKVSLRQWRIAESCELGLAASATDVLTTAVQELYRADVIVGDTGRARSTAEAERNVPPARLTRADLGWKSLLFAGASLPQPAQERELASVLLPNQGFSVLRRDKGRTYVALDYGEPGGGHGHPDRLNLWLVHRDTRILEDVGTGSYVDPSLHWYRSTLAHNAPLAAGTSQLREGGELVAWDEHGDFGWTFARATLAPNVKAERAVVVADGYLVDELTWAGRPETFIDLPLHVVADAPTVATWTSAPITGGNGLEDGFNYITRSEHSQPLTATHLRARVDVVVVNIWLFADSPFVLWRLHGPGPPNEPSRDFFVVRSAGDAGRIRTVIDWSAAVSDVRSDSGSLKVALSNGVEHTHRRTDDTWHVAVSSDEAMSLTRRQPRHVARPVPAQPRAHREVTVPRLANVPREPGALALENGVQCFDLGAASYRRSEPTWDEAGRPRAVVAVAATENELHIDIAVEKTPLAFAPARPENPLDNEHPDTNSDGVQLHLAVWNWLLVPEAVPNVRVTSRHSTPWNAPELRASWRPTPRGYSMRVVLPLAFLAKGDDAFFGDVIVNEMPPPPARERRRGQLVLSGIQGSEWVYLRGDRQDPSRFLRFRIVDA